VELVGLKGQWGRSGLECMSTSWTTEIADWSGLAPKTLIRHGSSLRNLAGIISVFMVHLHGCIAEQPCPALVRKLAGALPPEFRAQGPT